MKYRYPDVISTDKKTVLNGIGANPILDVPIWIIPSFILEYDSGHRIEYINVPIAVLESRKFSFDMIIPITMLNRMDFYFEYCRSARYAVFCIKTDKQKFYIQPILSKVDTQYLNKIQVFVEEDI